MEKSPRTLDPIISLPTQSVVNSLCFVSPYDAAASNPTATPTIPSVAGGSDDEILHHDDGIVHGDREDDAAEDSENDDSEDLVFRSAGLLRSQVSQRPHRYQQNWPSDLLRNRFLVSCHRDDGGALLWDLNRQTVVGVVAPPRAGSGLAVRRTHEPSKVLVHTKDPKGVVSLHCIERSDCSGHGEHSSATTATTAIGSSTIRQFETFSQTFCQAAPCTGNEHMLALPSIDDSTVVVVDDRARGPVATHRIEGHGMLTSLALSSDPSRPSGGALLACGMESGTAVFWDLSGCTTEDAEAPHRTTTTFQPSAVGASSTHELGKDPILTLDLTSSNRAATRRIGNNHPSSPDTMTVLVAAGMAGDAAQVADLKPDEAGRAVLFKVSVQNRFGVSTTGESTWTFEDRARLSTCRVDATSYGKPGVSVCRFRPDDGRLLAVGGWDYRIRLFERTKAPMAILKGNGGGSVVALDWAPDASTSGLMVSAPANAKSILLWRCLANGNNQ